MFSVAQTWDSPDQQPAEEYALQHLSAELAQFAHLLTERRTVAQGMSTPPTDDDLSAFLACDEAIGALMSRLEEEMQVQEKRSS